MGTDSRNGLAGMRPHPASRAEPPRLRLAALLGLVALVAVLLAWKAVPRWRRAERVQAAVDREHLGALRRAVSNLERVPNRSPEQEHLYRKVRRLLREREAKARPR